MAKLENALSTQSEYCAGIGPHATSTQLAHGGHVSTHEGELQNERRVRSQRWKMLSCAGTRYSSHLRFQPAQKQKRRRATTLDVSPDELRDKSIDEALAISPNETRESCLAAARKVLIEAGVLKGSQVGNRLWAALNRSERFEREEKGRYRLVPEEEDTPLLTPSVFISKSSR